MTAEWIKGAPDTTPPQFERCCFSCTIPCDWGGGDFCLARVSIPNRWNEDKGAWEEVEQKLMAVRGVQCVSSWLEDPMNKSKSLSLSVFLLPSHCLFLKKNPPSLRLSCSIALLCRDDPIFLAPLASDQLAKQILFYSALCSDRRRHFTLQCRPLGLVFFYLLLLLDKVD